ncbi:hypothetical protein ACIRL2_45015 [Embleya sp. NPDC127516]|uniref:hypothetical protein n=1 Tax=Embleya sp. NPDC127516 TaxID=3363990 RepID=UPI003827F541
MAEVLDKLVAAGVNTAEPGVTPGAATASDATDDPAAPQGPPPPAGRAVVVTGAMIGVLAALSRNEMNEFIERAGGRAASSVSATGRPCRGRSR